MEFNKLDFAEFSSFEILTSDKSFCYKFDKYQRNYQQEYFGTKFKSFSFYSTDGSNSIVIPIAKSNKDTKKLSFFGDPLQIFFKKDLNIDQYNIIKNKIESLGCEFELKIKIINEKVNFEQLLKNTNFLKIVNEIYIDLSLSSEEIKKKFSSNLRNEIKKEYDNVTFEIIDYENYKKDQILEMMELHKKVAGRQTRTIYSWRENEKMILDKKGFLTKVSLNNKTISYSFFCHDQRTCIYLSSAGIREFYSKIRNIHHKSLWLAINYVKKYCKFFFIGSITLHSKNSLTPKELNIERFKSKFKGINEKYIVLNNLPEFDFFQMCRTK